MFQVTFRGVEGEKVHTLSHGMQFEAGRGRWLMLNARNEPVLRHQDPPHVEIPLFPNRLHVYMPETWFLR